MKIKITNIEISSTMFLLIFSCTLGLAPFISIKISGIDSYFSVLFGSILGLIPLCIILYLFNYQIDKPINEKNKIIFGKTVGTIINYLTIPVSAKPPATGCNGQAYRTAYIQKATERTTIPTTTNAVVSG